jgi:hypothetical protein
MRMFYKLQNYARGLALPDRQMVKSFEYLT